MTIASIRGAQEFDAEIVNSSPVQEELAPAQEWQAEDWLAAEVPPEVPPIRSVSSPLLMWICVAALLLCSAEAVVSLQDAWQRGIGWFGLYAVVLGGSLLFIGRGLWREYLSLRQLKRNTQQRSQGERISHSTQYGEAEPFLAQLNAQLPMVFEHAQLQWQQAKQAHHNDAEQVRLYERLVLSQQDEAAERCIYRYAAQASLLLAASPMASLDMALMLWRNQSMLNEVSRIYGISPSYWSRVRLVRQILKNLLFAGGSQVAMDLGAQLLSTEITGTLSARLAQGLGAGLLTARLGYMACAECRPLPYQQHPRPSLMAVQGRLLAELKQVSADALQQVRARAVEPTKMK